MNVLDYLRNFYSMMRSMMRAPMGMGSDCIPKNIDGRNAGLSVRLSTGACGTVGKAGPPNASPLSKPASQGMSMISIRSRKF